MLGYVIDIGINRKKRTGAGAHAKSGVSNVLKVTTNNITIIVP